MIIQFAVGNYLSFDEVTVLQMITKSKETLFEKSDVIDNKTYKILKNVSIFGSNASGKTSFVKAISFFKNALIDNDTYLKAASKYCRIKNENKNSPSIFEIVLDIGNRFFQYGFSVILSEGTVVDEYLYEITPSTFGSKPIFSRKDNMINVSLNKNLLLTVKGKLTEAINNNKLFLSLICKDKTFDNVDGIKNIIEVYRYIINKIIVINKDTKSNYLLRNEINKNYVDILNNFDFNISAINKKDIDEDTIRTIIGSQTYNRIRDDLLNDIKANVITLYNSDNIYLFSKSDNGINTKKIIFKHFHSDSEFSTNEESDGTNRIMDLIPILFVEEEATFFIDEIESSLSSDMVIHFIETLRTYNNPVQLIFTTHADRLFDDKYLRRDAMFIVEKDNLGASHLKRVSQFKGIYSEKNINSKYLQNRYGGRPNIIGVNNKA